ncbi:MAG: tyrosine-type recombinase/integrase [Atribacterota bacterium]
MEKLELSNELCSDFMDWLRSKGYSYNTIRQYKHSLKKIQLKYRELSNNVLRKVLKEFKYQNQRAVLCAINNYCFDKGLNFRLLIPKLKTPPRKSPEIYSFEEIKVMINSAPKPYDLALRCIFNIGAGLRVSEMIKLSWNHIKWADWIKDKDNYGVVIIKSAKGSKDRVVNIPSNLMKDLYNYAKEKEILNEFGIPTGGMIFPMGNKTFKPRLMRTNIQSWKNEYLKHGYDWFRYNIIQKHCEKALGKKIKVHSLRHTKSTYLYEYEQVPIERIQLLLGHSDLSTTMIYTKVNPVTTFEMLKKTKEI